MMSDAEEWVLVDRRSKESSSSSSHKNKTKYKPNKQGAVGSSSNITITSGGGGSSHLHKNDVALLGALSSIDSSYQLTPMPTVIAFSRYLIDVMATSHYVVDVCDKIKSVLHPEDEVGAGLRTPVESESSVSLESQPQSLTLYLLGIGPIGNRQSFVQLCYSIALKNRLGMLFDDMEVLAFDPRFTQFEKDLLVSFGVSIIKDNTFGVIPNRNPMNCSSVSVFYMPHCPFQLYNNVLWSNWDRLSSTVIIGNRFSLYSTRREAACSSDKIKSKTSCCVNLLGLVEEYPIILSERDFEAMQGINRIEVVPDAEVENTSPSSSSLLKKASVKGVKHHPFRINHDNCMKAFNDTSISYFSRARLKLPETEALLLEIYPSADEIELVTHQDAEMEP